MMAQQNQMPTVLGVEFQIRNRLLNSVLRTLRSHGCHIVGRSVDGDGWEVKRNAWIAERIGLTRQIVDDEYLYWTRIDGVRVEYRMPITPKQPTHLECKHCRRSYSIKRLPMIGTPDLYENFQAGCPICGTDSLVEMQ